MELRSSCWHFSNALLKAQLTVPFPQPLLTREGLVIVCTSWLCCAKSQSITYVQVYKCARETENNVSLITAILFLTIALEL